jgi:glycosyltransferase involved in cell wall biosynthesis
MSIKVLYEVSNLGYGYSDKKSRAGIFRVIESILYEIISNPELDSYFTSLFDFRSSILTQQYFAEEKNNLLSKNLNYWNCPLISWADYMKILKNIHSNKSKNLPNRLKRKMQATFLQIIEFLSDFDTLQDNFDIYHSFFHALPPKDKTSNITRLITIHDMIPLLQPNSFDNSISQYFPKIINSIDRDQDWVICVSESTKNDFCNIAKMPSERVFVTPLAASNNFYMQTDVDKIQSVRKKYGIPNGKYILALSTLEPRKNTAHLIKCFYQMIEEEKINDVYLVLVGSQGWLYDNIFQTAESKPNLRERVIFTGYLPENELSSIYSGASFFVYPSLYEGFGLPPLEAMQCGTPVIASNTSSLPEVVGDAGILIEPKSEDQLCQAMLHLLTNSTEREKLSKKGLERSQLFSWSQCASDTINIYKKILDYK